jgi:1-acyl-sn-glycerol-3-phosphate acyltransferase
VVIANHISYLDSILMVSMFKRHTTIVKADLFTIPIMGLMLRLSGYLPSAGTGHLAEILVQRTEDLPRTLAAGDNLFIFPEGTRSRDGTIGEFSPGAFKLARLCRTPIHVLRIRNSDRLFKPGRFLFQTCRRNTISIDLAAQMNPHYDSQDFSIDVLMKQARQAMDNQPIDNEAA